MVTRLVELVAAGVTARIAHKVAASREILLGKEDLPKSATAAVCPINLHHSQCDLPELTLAVPTAGYFRRSLKTLSRRSRRDES
jgi:hypothetical protein